MLKAAGVPIQQGGATRFDEPIAGGIIGPVVDSSIDELMSSRTVVAGGRARPGPRRATVLVFETPAAALPHREAHRRACRADPPARRTPRRRNRRHLTRMQPRHAPKAVFDQAIALIQRGRARRGGSALPRGARQVSAATSTCRRCSARCSSSWTARTKRKRSLRDVIALAPTFAKPHEDLGYLLVQANRPADALPLLERATRLDPSLERAWFTLGKALALLGRGKDADAAFEKSLRAVAGAAADGARRRTPEGRPPRGGRARCTGACSATTRTMSMRCACSR